jgi:hypothetical protein
LTAGGLTLMQQAMLGDWWDPRSWLSDVGGFFHGVYDASQATLNAMGALLTVLTQFFRFFVDTGHFMMDAVDWVTNTLFPPELQTWFFGTIGAPGATWDPSQTFANVYHATQAPALAVAGVAATGRVLRGVLDQRLPAAHVIAETLPRFVAAVAIIGIPDTHVAVGYLFIVWLVDASVLVAQQLFALILHASLLAGVHAGEGWFSHVFHTVANAGRDAAAVIIGAVPLLILVVYALFLMVVRTVMLGFCVVTAPLCLATVAFDTHNRFFQWWFDILVSVLMTPIVLGVAISLSVTLASGVVDAVAVGPMLAFVVMCGGLWFGARMVHHLTWRHFSHGSAIGGFAAGVAAVLAPLHQVGSAGFVAEALGANRDGTNRAINLMKRLGVGAPGLHAGAGGAGGRTAVDAGRRSAPANAHVRATGGPPDIGAALSASGRAAVSGAEHRFASSAFNAFARGQAKVIGALTRDHAYGSISAGDRAKMAWERLPHDRQAEFADDFLSTWLGDAESPDRAAITPPPMSVPPLVLDPAAP